MIKYLLTIILLLATLLADTINVPEDFPTIQGALNAANNGDVIAIAEGTYFESNINPNGKTITITGEINDLGEPLVTIDGGYNGSVLNFVVDFDYQTSNTSIVENLIIKKGSAFRGGGINAPFGLTINNCIFDGNRADYGAGVAFLGDSNAMTTIQNCVFKNQLEHSNPNPWLVHPELGSAINANGNMTITNCIFENNASLSIVVFIGGTVLIDSCIFNNHFDGGTLIGLSQSSTDLTIINSNLIDNDASPISISGFSTALLENNLFRNNTGTVSIMQSNATINQCQFEDTELWIGEWDPINVNIIDSEFCDNGGNASSDSIEGPWTDLGGNSFSDVCEEGIVGDINSDGIINVLDVVMIVNIILNNEYNELADLNSDITVDILDIVALVNMILEQ